MRAHPVAGSRIDNAGLAPPARVREPALEPHRVEPLACDRREWFSMLSKS